jgi:hypothetical protein
MLFHAESAAVDVYVASRAPEQKEVVEIERRVLLVAPLLETRPRATSN